MKNRPLQPYSPAVLLSLALLVSTGSLAASQGVLTPWVTAPVTPTTRCVSLAPEEPDDSANTGSWIESISRAARQFHGLQHQLLAILHSGSVRVAHAPALAAVLPRLDPSHVPVACPVRESLLNLPPPTHA